ncbi:hypothetical protein [Streptomyces chartreusis]|uniref:hypothetical protein n=1 Tax=Streptomyces chartreusis TaxID=1969 RepID=UPI0037BAC85E
MVEFRHPELRIGDSDGFAFWLMQRQEPAKAASLAVPCIYTGHSNQTGLSRAGGRSTTSRGTMMLSESLVALAAAGGTAVVQAVGTDAWAAVRDRTARLFARGDAERHTAELARLEETARELTDQADCSTALVRWESSWRARWEMLLDSLPEAELPLFADGLTQVITSAGQRAGSTSISAGDHGLAVSGDVSIRAESGSLAGGVVAVEGGVSLADPFEGRSRPQ